MNESISGLSRYTKELKVLYVEDDISVLTYFTEVYGDLFDTIDTGLNGLEGINKYSQFNNDTKKFYDLIITDIVMPNMDGKTFIEHIHEINPHQNIIVASAYDTSTSLIDFINLGVDGFILKPFDDQKVYTALYKVCKNIYNRKELMKRTRELAQTNQQLELKIVRENRLHNKENEVISGIKLLIQSIENDLLKEDCDMELIKQTFSIITIKLDDLDKMIL